MPYIQVIPLPVQRTAADGLAVGNTVILNSTGNKKPVVLGKEVKGGLHYVEYLEYLQENEFRGITIGRREKGMLAYVDKEWRNGADLPHGKYYKLTSLAANGDATWEEFSFSGPTTLSTGTVFAATTIAERDAFVASKPLDSGDIVVVADASGDATVVPALTGGATYIYSGTGFVRFLFPTDPRLNLAHAQGTDTEFHVVIGGNTIVMQTRAVYDHINDPSIHFKINDANKQGSRTETYSSAEMRDTFLAKNPAGSATKFYNELGEAVEIQVDFNLTKINGGNASTQY